MRILVVPVVSILGIIIALTGSTYSSAVYLLIPPGTFLVSYYMKTHKEPTD
jgi:hypothetical protein